MPAVGRLFRGLVLIVSDIQHCVGDVLFSPKVPPATVAVSPNGLVGGDLSVLPQQAGDPSFEAPGHALRRKMGVREDGMHVVGADCQGKQLPLVEGAASWIAVSAVRRWALSKSIAGCSLR